MSGLQVLCVFLTCGQFVYFCVFWYIGVFSLVCFELSVAVQVSLSMK